MKYFWKEYPTTVILCILCLLMIPISIILYFVLGSASLANGMVNYGTPSICVGMILFLFEIFFVKHDKPKGKTDDEPKKER